LDVLIIDQIGKEFSGAGMDTKVVGRIMNVYEKESESPRITRVVVRDLSEASGGNATGIGLADYTTRRAVDKIDFEATALNCVTAVSPEKGRIPLSFASDKMAVEAALKTIGLWTPEKVRIAWISNTKDLELMAVSSVLLELAGKEFEVWGKGGLFELPYDGSENLPHLKDYLFQR
jgi:hypothetical protein